MIVCDIDDAVRYRTLSSGIAGAIDWLIAHSGDEFVSGAVELSGGIVVKCEDKALVPREKCSLEAHRRFIDIHVPLKGGETIGWASRGLLKYPHGEYDEVADIEFFGDSAQSLLHVKVGQLAIFFPEDAHAPNIGIGAHRKLCIKIPVE